MDALLETCPPDARAGQRRLFDFGESTLRGVMLRACQNAGIPHYSPHDFRHRHISVLLKRGLSRADVAELVGHGNTNELATYEHVVVEDV
jgi:integrase